MGLLLAVLVLAPLVWALLGAPDVPGRRRGWPPFGDREINGVRLPWSDVVSGVSVAV